jgi:hypothetical protein
LSGEEAAVVVIKSVEQSCQGRWIGPRCFMAYDLAMEGRLPVRVHAHGRGQCCGGEEEAVKGAGHDDDDDDDEPFFMVLAAKDWALVSSVAHEAFAVKSILQLAFVEEMRSRRGGLAWWPREVVV